LSNYYADKLNSGKLFEVYRTGIPRVLQYLDAEIDFVGQSLHGREKVLELGAGYGRIMKRLAPLCQAVVGIDISEDSLLFGKEYLKEYPNCRLELMDAHELAYRGDFDVVICLQNGLSSLKGQPSDIVSRSLDALLPGGRAYFSTYSPRFWDFRLAWFKEQAERGLLGEIDLEKTSNGTIVCKDGFVATTFSREDLEGLGGATGHPYEVVEVDNSSLFLVLFKE